MKKFIIFAIFLIIILCVLAIMDEKTPKNYYRLVVNVEYCNGKTETLRYKVYEEVDFHIHNEDVAVPCLYERNSRIKILNVCKYNYRKEPLTK